MMQHERVSEDDLDQAAAVARKLTRLEKLSALSYDLLSRQAEGRSLLAGEGLVAERAQALGISRKQAKTPYGSLLTILRNGPDSPAKWALLAALFLHGFERALADAERPTGHETDPESGPRLRELLARFVAHCDWLEVCTPYRVYPLLSRLLSERHVDAVVDALAVAVLRDDDGGAEARAYNAVRISALSAIDRVAARDALERIADSSADAFSRALCGAALSREIPAARATNALAIEGLWGRFPPRLPLALLRWLSGWASLVWLGHGLLWSLGCRTRGRVRLSGKALTVERTRMLLGRAVRQSEELHPVDELRLARRAARFPLVYSLVGVVSLCLGTLVGGLFLFDAVRVGELPLLAIGGALVLGGAGLDLLLVVLLPGRRARVALDLDLGPGARVRLSGVPQAEADRLLGELARLLQR